MLHSIRAQADYIQLRARTYTRQSLPAETTFADPKDIKKLLWKNHVRLQFLPGKYFFDPERKIALPGFNISAIIKKKAVSTIALTQFYNDLQKIIPADSWLFNALTQFMFLEEHANLRK